MYFARGGGQRRRVLAGEHPKKRLYQENGTGGSGAEICPFDCFTPLPPAALAPTERKATSPPDRASREAAGNRGSTARLPPLFRPARGAPSPHNLHLPKPAAAKSTPFLVLQPVSWYDKKQRLRRCFLPTPAPLLGGPRQPFWAAGTGRPPGRFLTALTGQSADPGEQGAPT